ncbi:unnamed protein product [Auanema sp. JU1783]|nr:unnamed protein product [Auanema sp. JU1783]
MGAQESKVNFRDAVINLTNKASKQEDDSFWEQLWSSESIESANDLFAMIPTEDIRKLRDESPKNLAALSYKALEKIMAFRENPIPADSKKVINCIRVLTRIMPYMQEDPEWRGYFWTCIPHGNAQVPMASLLLSSLSDLLFCPGFTVPMRSDNSNRINLQAVDSCEYIWEAGVGYSAKTPANAQHDIHRTDILKLLLTCFSELIYTGVNDENRMRWLNCFTSAENRHVLPLFTSLLNIVCAYDPVGMGVPYNYLIFNDTREPLVEASIQVLVACLDWNNDHSDDEQCAYKENFFLNYLSRIHREEDFDLMLRGVTKLLSNPLQTSYLPNSTKKVSFHQELLVFLWKCCEYNQKFMFYVLKTSDVLEILVPILYHIAEGRNDPTRVGMIHMGIFLILLLSGERNFGVRLNKPFDNKVRIDVQPFVGTHADLLILVFHKLITTGNNRLQSLFDCLLTIIVNVSPYLKSLSIVAANKLLHLVEAFSTPWFLFSSPTNHHLVFFLLEVFNNIIQYQFDGNSNLVYTIIRKRQVFYQLSNLPIDGSSIAKILASKKGKSTDMEIVEALKSPTAETAPTLLTSETTAGLAATPKASSMTGNLTEWEGKSASTTTNEWQPTTEWAEQWMVKLPLQTILRLLQVLVPQVEKICIDKGLTDETEILKFLQNGTLVGLLPVPHPILIRKYQSNPATNHWFRTYTWGVIYIRNNNPPIWFDTKVNLFEVSRSASS